MAAHRDWLVVFARAPEMGRVKTRLAAEVGAERARAIYRELASLVLNAVRDGPHQIVIAHSPADAEPAMRAWLGDAFVYAPQCDGDLGARMTHAFASTLEAGAERVVLIGTDCPTISAEMVLRLRLVPVVPFNMLNFAAGLAGVRFRDYLLGTLLGLVPGTMVYTYFADAVLTGAVGARREALVRLLAAGVLLVALSFLPALARRLGWVARESSVG